MKKSEIIAFILTNMAIIVLTISVIKPALYHADSSFIQIGHLPASQNIQLYGNIIVGIMMLFVAINFISMFLEVKHSKKVLN